VYPILWRADPAVVGQWISETQARKLAADARLRAATGTRPGLERMTKEQIEATINAIRDLMQALRDAATEDKAEIYAGLNLQLTYNPGIRTVGVRAAIGHTCAKGSCPRGDTTLSDPANADLIPVPRSSRYRGAGRPVPHHTAGVGHVVSVRSTGSSSSVSEGRTRSARR